MNLLLEKLTSQKVLVSDGAWGTILQSKGLKPGDCPEEWNVSHKAEIKSIPEAYIHAGAEMVLTNTFGGSPFKLENFGLADQTEAFNRDGVQISRDAAGKEVIVAASVGPTGKFLEPLGDVSAEKMEENFKRQISAQIAGGADTILIETMSDLGEAVTALKVAKRISDLPVMVTLTFEKGKQGFRTMMGVSVKQAVEILTESGANIIGTNCGNGIEQIIDIIAEMRQYTDKFLVAHPNAGLPKLIDGKTVFDQSPVDMAQHIPALIKAGANIIGGCCGTTPDHIAEIAKQVQSYRNAQFI